MSVRIPFDSGTPVGQMAAEVITELQDVRLKVQRLRAALYAMHYHPDGATWNQIETEVGVAAGKGQDFFTLWDGIHNVMNANEIGRLNEIDQG